MNNDKYNVQNPISSSLQSMKVDKNTIKPITQSNNNTPKPSNNNSIIYSNISPPSTQHNHITHQNNPQQQQQYQSQSTIRSMAQSDAAVINSPNYAVYSSIEDEKMLICKSQLVSFAQCFAQEKIQLQNTVCQLRGRVGCLEGQIAKLQEQNVRLKQALQSQSSNNIQLPSPTLPQQHQQMKSKLKQQFEKRILAQKQFHNQKAVSFELNKKIQFLTQKLVYQQQQLNRCQNLLKIKEDIIQNFQWQKSITTARNKNNQNNTNNSSINRNKQQQQSPSSSTLQQPFNTSNSQQYNEQNSPLMKKSFNTNSRKKSINQNNNTNNYSIPKQGNNQTLNLSQINLINSVIMKDDGVVNNMVNKKPTKYVINKKVSQSSHFNNNNGNSHHNNNSNSHHNNSHNPHNDSKKKLNVSLKKKSLNNSLQNLPLTITNNNNNNNNINDKQKSKQKSLKPKSIMLKRHTSTQSQLVNQTSSFMQIQKEKQFKAYYMRIITQLEKQNQLLKSQLTKANKSTSRFNDPQLMLVQPQLMGLKSNNNNSKSLHNKQQMQQHQRKYTLLKQKCTLLQNQIQQTVTKYLSLQQQNYQLQKIVQSLRQNQLNSLHQQKNYQKHQQHQQQQFNQQQQPLSRPSLGLADLVTPQFRQTKWNNNFFAKNKDQNHTQKLFQNISLHEKGYQNKNTFLDTFQKQKPSHQSCYIDNKLSKNSLFNIDEKTSSNVFKGSIQDVSEIICRNDQQEVLQETF